MIRLAQVIADFEADFLRQFRHRLSFDQVQALAAIKHCRSPASPMMQVQCTDCAHHRLVPHMLGVVHSHSKREVSRFILH